MRTFVILILVGVLLLPGCRSLQPHGGAHGLSIEAYHGVWDNEFQIHAYLSNQGNSTIAVATASVGPAATWNGNHVSVHYSLLIFAMHDGRTIIPSRADLRPVKLMPGEVAALSTYTHALPEGWTATPVVGDITYSIEKKWGERFKIWSGTVHTRSTPFPKKPGKTDGAPNKELKATR